MVTPSAIVNGAFAHANKKCSALSFTEPVHDIHHHEIVRVWIRRFAKLVDRQRRTPKIAGGYVMVGAYDDASAAVWASVMTQLARAHGLYRDGVPARFVVRRA